MTQCHQIMCHQFSRSYHPLIKKQKTSEMVAYECCQAIKKKKAWAKWSLWSSCRNVGSWWSDCPICWPSYSSPPLAWSGLTIPTDEVHNMTIDSAESHPNIDLTQEDLLAECQALSSEVLTLHESVKQFQLGEEFLDTDTKVNNLTKLPSHQVLEIIASTPSPYLKETAILSPFQQVVIVCMKLQCNISLQFTAYMFTHF